MEKISADKVKVLIKSAGRKISYCEFIKANGDLRKMWFQAHIPKKLITGKGRLFDPDEKRLVTVRDINIKIKPIRNIKWDSIKRLTVNGVAYEVEV